MFEFIDNLLFNAQDELTWVGKIAFAVLIYLLSRIVYVVIKKVLQKLSNRSFPHVGENKKRTVLSALQNFVKYILYFIAITLILDTFGVNTTSIIATAGIGGIAIAFGAQQVIQDLISGAFIILEDQFNVGDYVSFGDVTGTVEEVGMRKTKVRNYVGSLSMIPNSKIQTVTNYGQNPIHADILAPVPYTLKTTEVDQIVENIRQRAMSETEFFTAEPYLIGIDTLGDRTYTVSIGSIAYNGKQWEAQRYLRRVFLEELENRGVAREVVEVIHE